jgi:protein subunit release factor A
VRDGTKSVPQQADGLGDPHVLDCTPLEQEKKSGTKRTIGRQQIGTGQRGDKRRTIREQDGKVTDHVTGRKWRYADYVKGNW